MRNAPRELRRFACQLRRLVVDWLAGRRQVMVVRDAKAVLEGASFPVRLSLEQRIYPTDYVEAKIHNIALARAVMEDLPVPPCAIFSFWRIVGRPTATHGFQPGRSLLGGQLQPDYGGGLCQLSGILYHLCLQAGLEILERHPHSWDIYDDTTRYAPLGSDATVAYGFKDLRVLNTLRDPICFRLGLTPENLTAHLCSPAEIEPCVVEFVQIHRGDGICTVETRRRHTADNQLRVLNRSTYRRLL